MNENFPIVGIGASAGGLEALETFFKNMPNDSHMAFVVIMHLDPTHVSLLPELLQRRTKMEVIKINGHEHVKKNKIYVIPPHKNLIISNQVLELVEPFDVRIRLPIDFFFKSLAQDQGKWAACVILSGAGSDGSIGLQEIKAELGYVAVQSAQSAKYDGMPNSAIATGMANCVLPANEIPQVLIKYFNQSSLNNLQEVDDISSLTNSYAKILTIIRSKTGHDFAWYKQKTICRRIERRMQVHQITNIDDYLTLVEQDLHEVTTLFRDLLIGVTCFFRDKEAFDVLANSIFPVLLDNKPENYAIRVWVPGCSSGEEPYSIAILLQEYLISTGKNMEIQIFATDIDEHAIEKARSGLYPLSVKADLGEKFTQRYFIKLGDFYQVKKSVRELVVFAVQNLIKDPPFSRLDLICCRNLLIYFNQELQKHVFPIFHYSLKENGILFLGPSETTGQSNTQFQIINRKWKIFKRKSLDKPEASGLHFNETLSSIKMEKTPTFSTISPIAELHALQLVETILKRSQIPACVIVDDQMNIVYVHGRLGHYLEPAEGRLNANILEMTRSREIKQELSELIRRVFLHKKDVISKSVAVEIGDKKKFVELTVKLLNELKDFKNLVMVKFTESSNVAQKELLLSSKTHSSDSDNDNELVKELEIVRDDLEFTVKELESSNEELKSANEELQSVNEELQSTNEELETSKEELQSLNEESITVNTQLQTHIDELSTANDDIKNLLDSTQVATLFLDTNIKIRRFTPKMTDIIHLMDTDFGRPLAHISTKLQNIKLPDIANKVLNTLDKVEIDVADDEQNYYTMRVLPYRTSNNIIAGVVISFDNITTKRISELALLESEQRYKSLFDNCPVAILEIDTSKLANYIRENELTSLSKLKSHFSSDRFEAQQIVTLIQALNINTSGLTLFADENKSKLLKKLPFLLDSDTYLFNQMKIIVENKTSAKFESKFIMSNNKANNCEITITVPEVNENVKFANSILSIIPAT